jgi:hypothetical protein
MIPVFYVVFIGEFAAMSHLCRIAALFVKSTPYGTTNGVLILNSRQQQPFRFGHFAAVISAREQVAVHVRRHDDAGMP